MTDREAYVAFNLADKVGSVAVSALAAEAGSVAAAWEKYPKKSSRAGGDVDYLREFELAKRHGAVILTPADEGYPKRLLENSQHPLALYVKGDVSALSKSAIAIVGTRRATAYGLDQARAIAEDLAANGWMILSGLALGIDGEAHRGALAAKGITVGIIGSGLDCFYPEENLPLAREIIEKGGAVVSEFPFGRPPDQQTFPQRNHVVAALCRGIVAIEAPAKSGTLITTSFAADLGRTVMAVPGRVDNRMSAGCLALIRDGARLVRSARDVEEEMGNLFAVGDFDSRGKCAAEKPVKEDRPQVAFSAEESAIMRELDSEGVSIDSLVRKTSLSAAKVNSICMSLRIKGRIRYLPGNRVATLREK